jgi:hypothetical protein
MREHNRDLGSKGPEFYSRICEAVDHHCNAKRRCTQSFLVQVSAAEQNPVEVSKEMTGTLYLATKAADPSESSGPHLLLINGQG